MENTGWNMHSVINTVQTEVADTRLANAMRIVERHALSTLGRPAKDITTLRRLAANPRVELAHLRDLGTQLKFIASPFSYLDPGSYAEESAEKQGAIHAFVDVLSPMFNIYALCPLEHYSLARHIESAEDLTIMVPDEYLQIFQTLEMCLPIFRGIKQDIAELRQKLELNIRAQQERARLRLLDPMMFAVPKNKDIRDEGLALVGPAWGPDIDDILVQSYKLTVKPHQRQTIEQAVRTLLSEGNVSRSEDTVKLTVDRAILNRVTRHQPEIREDVRRFLEGDSSVLNEPPGNGHAYTLNDMLRVRKIADRCLVYLELLHRD